MKIEKISTQNFRALGKLDLHLNEQMNLIVGKNSVGKTSVLQAIASSLTALVRKMNNSRYDNDLLKDSDILYYADQAALEIDVVYGMDTYSWKIEQTLDSRYCAISEKEAGLTNLETIIKEKQRQSMSLPVIVYYPADRSIEKNALSIHSCYSPDEQYNLYNSATEGKVDFADFFCWYRDQHDYINQELQANSAGFNHNTCQKINNKLQMVTWAIQNIARVSEGKITRSPDGTVRLMFKRPYGDYDFELLSDKEKHCFALIGDIARRLVIGYPESKNPLREAGIILIDEIEQHLDPQSQRYITERITDIFPNCQFIITSNSPMVISQVRPESVIILTNSYEIVSNNTAQMSYGKSADWILENILGVPSRTDYIDDQIKMVFGYIRERDFEKALVKIAALRNTIGDDSELTKAIVLIKRLEIRGGYSE